MPASSHCHPPPLPHAASDAGAAIYDPAAAVLTRDLIDEDETIILLLRPSIWYVPLASLASLGVILLVTFVLAYLAPWAGWDDVQAFALGAGLVALRLGWQTAEWLSRVYVLTDRRVITRGGVLYVVAFQTPLRNVQHTSLFITMRERLFGLGTIGFATAGSDRFESFWVMVRRPELVHRTIVEAMDRYAN